MTKAEISELIAEKTGHAARDTKMVVEQFLEEVKNCLVGNKHLEIRGFGAFKECLRRAKALAQKSKDQEKFEELKRLDDEATSIIQESQIEQWIIDENVHYNKWDESKRQDFEPIVEVFKKLFALFSCESCGSMMMLERTRDPRKNDAVRCNCGKIFWDLGKR